MIIPILQVEKMGLVVVVALGVPIALGTKKKEAPAPDCLQN